MKLYDGSYLYSNNNVLVVQDEEDNSVRRCRLVMTTR